MFKPAFEAHPLFRGNVVVGGPVDEAKLALGEPSGSDRGTLLYTMENSAGATIDGRFWYLDEKDLKEYVTENASVEYFQNDNDYYTVANAAYMEMQNFVDDVRTSGKGMNENLTYGDVANAFGTPGYIYVINTDYGKVEEVRILWVNTEADGETGSPYVFASFHEDGTSTGMFGATNEIGQVLRNF